MSCPSPGGIPLASTRRIEHPAPSSAGATKFSTPKRSGRTNTTGGLAPTEPGTTDGQLKEVPYTAEYYFYRAEN